jgi:hypothetical protein
MHGEGVLGVEISNIPYVDWAGAGELLCKCVIYQHWVWLGSDGRAATLADSVVGCRRRSSSSSSSIRSMLCLSFAGFSYRLRGDGVSGDRPEVWLCRRRTVLVLVAS